MIWRAIDFDWPGASLFLLFTFILAALFVFLKRFRQRRLGALAMPSLLDTMVEPRAKLLFWAQSSLFCLAWVFGVFALMQPKGNGQYVAPNLKFHQNEAPGKVMIREVAHEVILLVDASASMGVSDTESGNPRLKEAKEVAEEIIGRLSGENVSLYAFTSATMQLVPSTTDYLFTRLMLRQLSINEGETEGTDLLEALKLVRQIYFSSPNDKHKTLILLSDGGDTHLESLQGKDRETYQQKMTDVFKDQKGGELTFFSVGLGSIKGGEVPGVTYQGRPVLSAIDEDLLRQLSLSFSGKLLLSREMTTLQSADQILKSIKKNRQFKKNEESAARIQGRQDQLHFDLYFQTPLLIAILSLALALLIPETLRKRRPH